MIVAYLAGVGTLPALAVAAFWALCLWDTRWRHQHIRIVRQLRPDLPRRMFQITGDERNGLAWICRRLDFAVVIRLPFVVPK